MLWTVERCGVLFNRREIGGKDWYRWGVELLLNSQRDNGPWADGGGHPGSMPIVDTCSPCCSSSTTNLAKELTKKLEFFMEGKKRRGLDAIRTSRLEAVCKPLLINIVPSATINPGNVQDLVDLIAC